MWSAALIGFLLGFIGSMPIAGPISILVFKLGLAGRYGSAWYLAAGGATAESGYAYLAFWGFSEFLVRYAWIEPVSRALAALLLTTLGLRLALGRSDPGGPSRASERQFGERGSWLMGFTITALNPALVATWGAGVSMAYASGKMHFVANAALPFALGAGSGIVSWVSLLLTLLRRYRHRLAPSVVGIGMRLVGGLVALLGLGFGVRFVLWLVS